MNDVAAMPLSAELKQGFAETPSKGHALICCAAALLSAIAENRTTAPQALPGAKLETPI